MMYLAAAVVFIAVLHSTRSIRPRLHVAECVAGATLMSLLVLIAGYVQ